MTAPTDGRRDGADPGGVGSLRRRARWSLAFRLARREARRHPWRQGLVVLLIFVPVAATFAAFSGIDTAMALDHRRAETAYADADVVLDLRFLGYADPDRAATPLAAPSPGVHVERAWRGVDWLVPEPTDPSAPVAPVETLGLDGEGRLAGRMRVDRGRLPVGAGEVFLTDAAARLGDWSVGDELRLATTDRAFTVVGIGADRHGLRDRTVVLGASEPEEFWTRSVGGDLAPIVVNGNYRDPNEQVEQAVVWVPAGVDPSSVEPVRSHGAFTFVRPDLTTEPGVRIGTTVAGAGVAMVAAVVASAAFAIGARRQLRNVGLLATAGADPGMVRAALVWQGALPGAAAAGLAVASGGALAFVLNTREIPERITHLAGAELHLSLLGALVATALGIGAGMAAAWQPARSTARLPLLSLLGGRRPLPPVRRRVPLAGLGAVAAGCLLLAVSPELTAEGHALSALVPIVGVISFALGAVGLAPALVAALGPLAGRATGLLRLALRGLVRHRGQSAATVAAMAVALALPIGLLTAYPHPDAEQSSYVGPDGVRRELVDILEPDALLVGLGGMEAHLAADPAEAEQIRRAYERREADVLAALDEPPVRVPTIEVPVPDDSDLGRSLGGSLRVAVVPDDAVEEVLAPWAARQIQKGRVLVTGFAPTDAMVLGTEADQIELRASTRYEGRVPTASVIEADLVVDASTAARIPGARLLGATTLVRSTPPSAAERRSLEALVHPERRDSPTLAQVRAARDLPVATATLGEPVYVNVREPERTEADPWALAMAGMAAVAALLALVVLTITLSLRSVDGADDLRAAVAAGAPPASLRRVRAIEGVVLTSLGAALALPLGWLPVAALRWGASEQRWVPGLGGPGWLAVPVLVAPVVLAALLWTVVPALRAGLTGRSPVDQILPNA